MRILVTTQLERLVAGAESYLDILLPALVSKGHVVGLLAMEQGPETLPGVASGSVDQRFIVKGRSEREALSWIDTFGPEVVFNQGIGVLSIEQALLSRYRAALFLHAYYGACISGAKHTLRPTPRPCARPFGPACLLHYLPRGCGGLNPLTALELYRFERARQQSLTQYRKVLVGAEQMKTEYRKYLDAAKIEMVSYPFPAGPPRAIPKHPITGSLLFVGRLTRLKGVEFLLRALPMAAQALGLPLTLTLAGDGPDLPRLQALAIRLNVPARFVGRVDAVERDRLMSAADLLVVPSTWPEPFGLVGLEAARQGLPAAAFSVGGIPEWLVPGVSGELAPAGPPEPLGLAMAITRALSDPNHHRALREGALARVSAFSVDQHVRRVEICLQEVAQGA